MQPYDSKIFERWIYEEFVRQISDYQTQDMKCRKCNKVQARKMNPTCEDGGDYQNVIPSSDFIFFMRKVVKAAKLYNFKYLYQIVAQYLKLSDPEGSKDLIADS